MLSSLVMDPLKEEGLQIICNDYCVDSYTKPNVNKILINYKECYDGKQKIAAIIKYNFSKTVTERIIYLADTVDTWIHLALTILSIVGLIATAVIYLIVPLLSDLTGKALSIHCIFLASVHTFQTLSTSSIDKPWIKVTAQFCQLSAYAWLTIMWINIFLVVHECIKKEKCQCEYLKKMYVYGAIACGLCIPVLLIIIAQYCPDICIKQLKYGKLFANRPLRDF